MSEHGLPPIETLAMLGAIARKREEEAQPVMRRVHYPFAIHGADFTCKHNRTLTVRVTGTLEEAVLVPDPEGRITLCSWCGAFKSPESGWVNVPQQPAGLDVPPTPEVGSLRREQSHGGRGR